MPISFFIGSSPPDKQRLADHLTVLKARLVKLQNG
jgi:hypothetical protein